MSRITSEELHKRRREFQEKAGEAFEQIAREASHSFDRTRLRAVEI